MRSQHRSLGRRLPLPSVLPLGMAMLVGTAGFQTVRGSEPPGQQERPPGLSVNEVLDSYEKACAAVWSFDISVKDVNHNLLTRTVDIQKEVAGEWREIEPENREKRQVVRLMRQYYSQGKFRVESLPANNPNHGDVNVTTVWDGMVQKELDPSQRSGVIFGHGKTLTSPSGVVFLDLYRSFDGEYSYVDLIRSRPPQDVTLKQQGRLIVVTTPPQPDLRIRSSGFGVTLVLDPDRGFMPTTIDLHIVENGELVLQSRYENELSEVEPGVWLPLRCRLPVYVRDKTSAFKGKELGYHLVEVDRSRSRFNCDLNESLFTLQFPPGTVVTDEIRKTRYQVGSGTRENYLSDLAVQGRLSAEELREARPKLYATTVVSRPIWKQVLVWVNVAALVGLMIVIGYRWWWKKRSPVIGSPAERSG
jgi:hypothetical protein